MSKYYSDGSPTEAATDPNPVYLTQAEADALYASIGAVGGGPVSSASFAQSASVALIAITANSASYAALAGQAASASVAILALTANSASYAALAGQAVSASFAQSASFATQAGFAQSASYAAFAGALTGGGGGADPWTGIKLPAAFTASATSHVKVTGMSFSATTSVYYLVDLVGTYQTAATTTGIAAALDVPAGATVMGINQTVTSATAQGGAEQVADATTTGATTGTRAANTDTPIQSRWLVSMGGTAGVIELMIRSEVAASNAILRVPTLLMYRTF